MPRGIRRYTVNLHLDEGGNILSAGLVVYDRLQEMVGLRAMTPEPFSCPCDVVRELVGQIPVQCALFDQDVPLEIRRHSG